MAIDCEVTQQTFKQMGLDFNKIFGTAKSIDLCVNTMQKSIFDDDEEEQESDPNEFADESDDFVDDWFDDDGSIYSQD